MIYKVWVKDGIIKSVEEVDTSNPNTGSPCMGFDDYARNMKGVGDFAVVKTHRYPYATLTCAGAGINYYVEADHLAVAANRIDSVLMFQRLTRGEL